MIYYLFRMNVDVVLNESNEEIEQELYQARREVELYQAQVNEIEQELEETRAEMEETRVEIVRLRDANEKLTRELELKNEYPVKNEYPTKDESCGNCPENGFPCLNCADYVFLGTKGPGFLNGVRTLLPNNTDPEVNDAMIRWAAENKVDYVIE